MTLPHSPPPNHHNIAVTKAESSPAQDDVVADVCCGCRPSSKRRFRKNTKRTTIVVERGKTPSQHGLLHGDVNNNDDEDSDSLFFFDACETPLGDDEYPPNFTNYLPPKRKVSMKDPSTMLSPSNNKTTTRSVVAFQEDNHHHINHDHSHHKEYRTQRSDFSPIASHQARSQRFLQVTSRSTVEHAEQLQQPRVKIPLKGYPGDLTVAELLECQKFVAGLAKMDPSISEQVYSFRDVEEEPYTICRWLRATKFDATAILKRLEENQAQFAKAQAHDFYPDVSQAIGAPFSVFLSQFPFLPIGRAKNGCPVNYFQAGKIHPEGILACTTPERLEGYFWWSFMYKFKGEMRKARAQDENFVRMEGINIIDLNGLSSDSLSGDTMDVIKLSSKISDFFPETLHCMLIINAPAFFSLFWGVIKKFIDPRTAARIQVFSNTEKGLAAMCKLIAQEQIPVDYGGTNTSIKQAFTEEAADPTLLRQEIQLLHVNGKKKAGKVAEFKEPLTLKEGEYLEVRVFTRSVTSADVVVLVDDQECARLSVKGGRMLSGDASASANAQDPEMGAATEASQSCISISAPTCELVVSKLKGPAKNVMIRIQDSESSEYQLKKSKGSESRGYFLVACDIKKQQ